MKKINLLFAVLMLLMLGNTNKIFAETVDIVWSSYAKPISSILTTNTSDPTYVYLYNVKSKQFITCGDIYGMQGIMTNVGMKFYITEDDYGYYIHSNVKTLTANCGDHLGLSSENVYIDRNDNIYWNFVKSGGSDTHPQYNIRYTQNYWVDWHNWYSYYLNQGSSVLEMSSSDEGESCDWMIITRQDYLDVTAQAKYEQIDVTGLLEDSRFDRNSKSASSWKWGDGNTGASFTNNIYKNKKYSIGVEEYNGGASNNDGWGKYFAAEIDNKSTTLNQTVTDLKEGIYRITCQGFYYNYGYDNANSYLYATNGTDNSSILLNTYNDNFESVVNNLYKGNKKSFTKNWNLAAGQIFLANESGYANEVYIYVHAGQSLTFGLNKTGTDGYAFVDNFKLYYCGKNEIYLNEEGTETSLDKGTYKFPCRLNYRRAFTKNAWNAIVLPISLSGSQVRAAFGEDAKLSELVGINPDKPSQILFKTVNLGTSGIEAGKCYVIWVTADPDVAVNKEYDYSNNNTKYKIYGPLYQIEGVTKTGGEPTEVTNTYTTTAGDLTFNGYYYKTSTNPYKDTNNYSYYITDGKMYYNTQDFPIYATRWTLKDKDNDNTGIGAKYTFNFDGISEGNGTTAIENINTDTSTNAATSNTVYNLNGQVVRTNSTSLEGLAKGIYIVNGKKYIVK